MMNMRNIVLPLLLQVLIALVLVHCLNFLLRMDTLFLLHRYENPSLMDMGERYHPQEHRFSSLRRCYRRRLITEDIFLLAQSA